MKCDLNAALLESLPERPDAPVEAPPAASFDLQKIMRCPACNSPEAQTKSIDDTEVAVCPACQCEFTPRVESISRTVIRRISERREKRLRRVMEDLPDTMPGIDPADYQLIKHIIDVELPAERRGIGKKKRMSVGEPVP